MDHLSTLRHYELETVLRRFPSPGSRVIEIGGGTGWQARILADHGYRVDSVDINHPSGEIFFPVQLYDGCVLPFPDKCFDIVFSSNVLEHVTDLDRLLREMIRILKPGGKMIHVLPTTGWRIWTSLTHYPFLLKYVASAGRATMTTQARPTVRGTLKRLGFFGTLRNALIPPPHGISRSSFLELSAFSAKRWRQIFRKAGLDVIAHQECGLFYTGHSLVPQMNIRTRQRIAHGLGSASAMYELSPHDAKSSTL
jgi:SAM-dependent methyltransferase